MKVSYGWFVSVAASLLMTGAELTRMAGLRLVLESNQPASPRASGPQATILRRRDG